MSSPAFLDLWLPLGSFFVLGAMFSLGEWLVPRRRGQAWRAGLLWDTISMVSSWVVTGVTISAVNAAGQLFTPPELAPLSPGLRLALYMFASDLIRFLVHYAMHSDRLWTHHRFHHSIEVLHWYAGNRASILHVALFMGPMAFFAWFFGVGPLGIAFNAVLMVFWNHMMHTNMRLPAGLERFLEYFVTTPRYHHVHHSTLPQHRDANIASVLTVWDRIFGTYVSPDSIDLSTMPVGSGEAEPVPMWRQLIGLS